MKHEYELISPLNDPDGTWLKSHSTNRYRDWGELRYSLRSAEQYAGAFINKIQILVNSVVETSSDGKSESRKQRPNWLKTDARTDETVQLLSLEDFFEAENQRYLPTFNSLTVENQIPNTQSEVDMVRNAPHQVGKIC
jgi:hypothetical protein